MESDGDMTYESQKAYFGPFSRISRVLRTDSLHGQGFSGFLCELLGILAFADGLAGELCRQTNHCEKTHSHEAFS